MVLVPHLSVFSSVGGVLSAQAGRAGFMEVNLGALVSHWFRFGFALVSLWFRFGCSSELEPGAWSLELALVRFGLWVWIAFGWVLIPSELGLSFFFSSRHLTF